MVTRLEQYFLKHFLFEICLCNPLRESVEERLRFYIGTRPNTHLDWLGSVFAAYFGYFGAIAKARLLGGKGC